MERKTTKIMKTCNGCTKCCEGYLSGKVKNIPFYLNKPCFFLEINKGCSIYEERPESPCKTFNCLWKKEKSFPEKFKPNLINAIVYERFTKNNIPYVEILNCEKNINKDFLEYIKIYCKETNKNLFWKEDDMGHALGSSSFIKEMTGKRTIIKRSRV